MAVNLDDGGIYHGVFAVGIGIEGLKDLGENPAFNPTAVTLEYAVPVAKFGRQIAPWAAGTDNPQDGFDKETVIGCFAGVACLAAAQRLYFGPLGICQDISASHGTMLSGNYVCQQALGAVYNLHPPPFRAKPVGAVLEAVCNLKNPPPLQGEARSGGGLGRG